MTGFVLRRIAWGALVVWLVATLVFIMYFAVPRDVARLIAGRQASEETLAAVRARLGLDQPIIVQYGRFIGRLARGDLGQSFNTQEPGLAIVARDLPVSASLALGGAALWLLMGVGAGVVAATRPSFARSPSPTVWPLSSTWSSGRRSISTGGVEPSSASSRTH
mgnify:CR=1 FL=1